MAGKHYRRLVQVLTEAGRSFARPGTGDHEIWYGPISDRRFAVDRNGKNRHTANATLKAAGLPKAF